MGFDAVDDEAEAACKMSFEPYARCCLVVRQNKTGADGGRGNEVVVKATA
jgi:hypothetical protein